MPQNETAVENSTVEDITELAWEDLVMEMDNGSKEPILNTGGANTFTYDQTDALCD